MNDSFYTLKANKPSGEEISMADFKDKAVLIVNTATRCGLTPQLKGLEKLHQNYSSKGLVVIGFPCNQFASQEPETNETMVEVCKMNHGVSFQLTEKVDVNGENTHPVFSYLKDTLSGFLVDKTKWNFTKFLVSPESKPLKRYAPTTTPAKIEKDIQEVLNLA